MTSRSSLAIQAPIDLVAGAFSAANAAVGTRSILPVLSSARLSTADGVATILCTDLEWWVAAKFPAPGASEGAVCVNAGLFRNALTTFPRGAIQLEENSGHLTVKAGRSTARLPLVTGEEFPPMPMIEYHPRTFVWGAIKEALRGVLWAVAHESETGAITALRGISWQSDGKTLKLAASDRHCIAVGSVEIPGGRQTEGAVTMVVPGPVAVALMKLFKDDDEIEMGWDRDGIMLGIRSPGVEMIARLVGETFPPYEHMILKDWAASATVSAPDLIAAIKRASIVHDAKFRRIELIFSSANCEVRASSGDRGSVVDSIEVTESAGFESPDQQLPVAYDSAVLLGALGNAPTKLVQFRLIDDRKMGAVAPAGPLAEGRDWVAVLAPMVALKTAAK